MDLRPSKQDVPSMNFFAADDTHRSLLSFFLRGSSCASAAKHMDGAGASEKFPPKNKEFRRAKFCAPNTSRQRHLPLHLRTRRGRPCASFAERFSFIGKFEELSYKRKINRSKILQLERPRAKSVTWMTTDFWIWTIFSINLMIERISILVKKVSKFSKIKTVWFLCPLF